MALILGFDHHLLATVQTVDDSGETVVPHPVGDQSGTFTRARAGLDEREVLGKEER